MTPLAAIAGPVTPADGGRVFFSNTGRSLVEEDEIELVSVGIDVGSSTAHLLFSKIALERRDARYVVTGRRTIHRSGIRLTPYLAGDDDIDADALGVFVAGEYAAAGLAPSDVDTGALILTGVAMRRRNARAIGERLSADAGTFVAVAAGDRLEALMAAHGSGAVARSAETDMPVLNIDVGGGTTKLAVCQAGGVQSITTVEAGARLVVLGDDGTIVRAEAFGRRDLDALGLDWRDGGRIGTDVRQALAGRMAERVLAAAKGADLGDWLRLPPLAVSPNIGEIVFSGGVAEYIHGREPRRFNDLGPELAAAIGAGVADWGVPVHPSAGGIRATVVGAAQYTVQVSGTTIYLDPPAAVPVRNVAVIAPPVDLSGAAIDENAVAAAVAETLARHELAAGDRPVAVALPWAGSATFQRLRPLCRGLIGGLAPVLAAGHPLILVIDGDVGGLIGIHCRHEEKLANPIVSIDGIALAAFDFVDIGDAVRGTGAVPVVIKSLLFPSG